MMGPGPRRRGTPMPAMSIKGQGKLLARVLKFIMKNYGFRFCIVLLCIFATAFCTLQGTLFTEDLIDVYIAGIMNGTKTFADLSTRLFQLAGILACGIACSYLQQRIMVVVTQGSMLKIRNELFSKMEELPIKYFDTHSHGDIMSVYTNDVDTMRMLIGQSLTQLVNSATTLVMTFISMVTLSPIMTVLSIVLVSLTMLVSGKLVGLCGKYFVAQQENLGKLNGFIEEMTRSEGREGLLPRGEGAGELQRAEREPPQRLPRGKPLVQHHGPDQQQPRPHLLRHLRHGRFRAGHPVQQYADDRW